MSQLTLHDLNPAWLQEAEFGGFTLATFYCFSCFCTTDLVARKVKFQERRRGSCDVCWRKLGALIIDTKINLTWLTHSMDSFLSPQFPVLPELPLSNCTQSGLPVSSPCWARAAGCLTYRWCLSFMRLVFSVETTDLLSSMRTDQRPRLLSFINIQPEAKWMILLQRWILKAISQKSSSPKPLFSKLLIDTDNFIYDFSRSLYSVWNVNEVRGYLQHKPSHLTLRSLFFKLWSHFLLYEFKALFMGWCPLMFSLWETTETVRDFIFRGSRITADGDCSHEIKRHLLLGRKVMTNLDSILKSRDITLPTKVHLVKAMVFPVSHVWMWELDYEESWAPKNWCFWTVVLEKTLESPVDCKEIQPVHPKGDQFWVFIGRTDAKAETPVLWPPHAKSWLIGKDSDAGRD